MELIKKLPAQDLDRSITRTVKDVSFERKGIIVASTKITDKIVKGVKSQLQKQVCFKLSVSNNANHELVNAFLQ